MLLQNISYIIKSKDSGKVLQISNSPESSGSAIIHSHNGGLNQKFKLKPNGPLLQIFNQASKKVITVQDGSPNNGISIIESQDEGKEFQRFRFQEVAPDSNQFFIYTFCGKVLDCFECSKSNGTKIVQWQFNGGANQKWALEKQSK